MITLTKIRSKYLSNHCCSVFFSYYFVTILFIPIIIIMILMNDIKEKYKNKIDGKAFNITKELFSQNILLNKYNFSLVSNDEKDKKILQELIKKDIEWSKELDRVNQKNFIININNENGKYKIELIQSSENKIFNSSSNTFDYFDRFLPPDYYSKEGRNDFEFFNEFIQLQSLFAQFLIKKNGNLYSQKELTIELGENSYPPHIDLIYPNIVLQFGGFISIQFTMTAYFFSLWMIEEKEKKLTELLERHGISKKNYFFSWLFAYLLIINIPLIIYILLFLIIDRGLILLLFILNIILFVFSLFCFTYFLYICIPKTHNGSIIIKFINITSSIIGYPLTFKSIPRIGKLLSALVPQINIFHCSNSIRKLLSLRNLSLELFFLQIYKISFMECIFIYLFDIIFI